MSRRHFAVADVRKFEQMWLTVEAEVKELVERALVIDSLICKQHLGLAWERPRMAFMELSGPIRPQKHACQEAVSQLLDASVGPRLEADTLSPDIEMYKEEEGKLSVGTLKKVMELLCDEGVRRFMPYCWCKSV